MKIGFPSTLLELLSTNFHEVKSVPKISAETVNSDQGIHTIHPISLFLFVLLCKFVAEGNDR